MKSSAVLAVCLLVVCLMSVYPAVDAAQTSTRIHQIDSPRSVIAGSENPIPVTVTVYYNNTIAGDHLLVGILDAGLTPQRIVPGVVVSSTDPCVNQPEAAALCEITTRAGSGAEGIAFQIGGIFGGKRGPGPWNLNITSALFNLQNSIISGSVSSSLFEVILTPVPLNVVVPSPVAVSIDGVRQPPGPTSVGVALGQHNITVPDLVQVDQSTRLRFDYWSDGYPTTLRNIVVTGTTTLQAVYVTQNLLTLMGVQQNLEQNATGAGWYDATANATFSANRYEPITGVLGAIGGRLSFQGWYENGQLVTNSPTGTISMDKPHTLTAIWGVDYSTPAAIMLGIIAVIIIFLALLRRRNEPPHARRRSKSRRKHS